MTGADRPAAGTDCAVHCLQRDPQRRRGRRHHV